MIKLQIFCAVATASGLPGLAISFISVVFTSNWPHNLQVIVCSTLRYSWYDVFLLVMQDAHLGGLQEHDFTIKKLLLFVCVCVQSGAFIDKIPISTAGLVLLKFPLSLPNLFRHISYVGHLIKIWEVICS